MPARRAAPTRCVTLGRPLTRTAARLSRAPARRGRRALPSDRPVRAGRAPSRHGRQRLCVVAAVRRTPRPRARAPDGDRRLPRVPLQRQLAATQAQLRREQGEACADGIVEVGGTRPGSEQPLVQRSEQLRGRPGRRADDGCRPRATRSWPSRSPRREHRQHEEICGAVPVDQILIADPAESSWTRPRGSVSARRCSRRSRSGPAPAIPTRRCGMSASSAAASMSSSSHPRDEPARREEDRLVAGDAQSAPRNVAVSRREHGRVDRSGTSVARAAAAGCAARRHRA